MVYFKCRHKENAYHLPKHGYLFAMPFLSVNNYKQIEGFTDKLVNLWKEKGKGLL